MKAFELNLRELYPSLESHESDYERVITVPTSALGTLRRELIETIGPERAKGFLLRYGWHCGVSDGSKAQQKSWENDKELILAGPRLHSLHGNVEVIPMITEIDVKRGLLHFEGHWKNSYEAREHLKLFGPSDQPVCHSLAGYASGYLSLVMGKKVIAKEIRCEGMGHDHCHWVCKTEEEWDAEIQKELKYYEVNYIIDELDQTYQQLKFERDNLSKAYHVHQKLMTEILRENELKSIAKVIYQNTGRPILIEDSSFQLLAFGGMNQKEAQAYSEQLKMARQPARKPDDITRTCLLEVSTEHRRVMTPIYLRKKIIGYCSFLHDDSVVWEVDSLILEQASMACSLYLLNERTRIQAEQRMRGSLLEDILSKRITKTEIIKRAHHIDFDWKDTGFFMVAFNRFIQHRTIKEEMEFNDQFIDDLSHFFQSRKLNAIIGQKSGHVVILLTEEEDWKNQREKEELCAALLRYCSQKYPDCRLKLGVSSSSDSIEDALNQYEETQACLKIAVHNQDIIYFDSLGIVGILFQTRNQDGLHKFASKTLGSLLKEDKLKNMDLTKTLYHYLNNGCHVKKTARAMNFSVTGLRYRLQRIADILKMDVNEPSVMHQIYLALQSLIVLGELEMEEGREEPANEGLL